MYPDWVLKHKKKGTNISKIGDKYYLYEVTSKWNKEKGRAQKITKGYLGRITEEGFIPKKEKASISLPVNPTVKSYGEALVAESVGKDILEKLRLHFPEYAETIFAAAVLRLIHTQPFKRLQGEFEHSFLSELFPEARLSKNSLTALLQSLGDSRERLSGFMREFTHEAEHLLFDGTSIITQSRKMGINNVGYNAHRQYDPQVNLMYAFSVESNRPVYYRVFAGNVRDVSAFELCVKESGLKGVTVIADKGFGSEDNFEMLTKTELDYIVPLKRNGKAYANTRFENGNKSNLDGYFIYGSRPIWYYQDEGICFFLDEDLRAREEKDYIMRIEKKLEGFSKEGFLEKQYKFGTIALRSNLKLSAEEVYSLYKQRGQIEQTFDLLKNLLDQDSSYMQSQSAMEGWAFINHISLLLCYNLYNMLRVKKLLAKFSVPDFISHLRYIHKIRISGEWYTSEVSKKTADFLSSLDIHIT